MTRCHFLEKSSLSLRRFIDAGNSIQASGITDVRQALGHHLGEELFVIAQIHIAFRMGGKLGFAPALGGQVTEGDHFPLFQIQPGAGVIISKTVGRQPIIDMA